MQNVTMNTKLLKWDVYRKSLKLGPWGINEFSLYAQHPSLFVGSFTLVLSIIFTLISSIPLWPVQRKWEYSCSPVNPLCPLLYLFMLLLLLLKHFISIRCNCPSNTTNGTTTVEISARNSMIRKLLNQYTMVNCIERNLNFDSLNVF